MKGNFRKVLVIVISLLVVVGFLTVLVPEISDSETELTYSVNESVGTGDNVETAFDFTLERYPVEAKTLVITDDVETFTDNSGNGTMDSDGAGTCTVNLTTGLIDLDFAVAPTDQKNIYANYGTEDVPAILELIAAYWWIGLTVAFIALIMNTRAGRRLIGRRRRGKRRR